MTTAERLCEEVGVPIAKVCKKAQITPRTLNRYCIHGASSYCADKLAWAFDYKIDTKIFLWGYPQWQRLKKGDNRVSPSGAGGDASTGQRPDLDIQKTSLRLVRGGKSKKPKGKKL